MKRRTVLALSHWQPDAAKRMAGSSGVRSHRERNGL